MQTILALLIFASQAHAFKPLEELQFKQKDAARFCSPLSRDLKRWKTKEGGEKIPVSDRARAMAYMSACHVLTFDYTPADEKLLVEALKANPQNALAAAESAFDGCWNQCFSFGRMLSDSSSELSKNQKSELQALSVALLKKPKYPSPSTATSQQKFLQSAAKSKLFRISPEKLAAGDALVQKLKVQTDKLYEKENAIFEKSGKDLDEETLTKVFAIRADAFHAIRPLMTQINDFSAEIAGEKPAKSL
jgi:hypothetical protein